MLPWERRLTDKFHRLYYNGSFGHKRPYNKTTWLGVPTLKCPMDLVIYQEILFRTRPDMILECGANEGGSALFLASICDLIDHGEIVAVDITTERVHSVVTDHPRITVLEGSSTDPEIVKQVRERCEGKRTMVILDSDHAQSHVAAEMEAYSSLVASDLYMIVEDTNLNGHPICRRHGPGPYEAVEEFLQRNSGWSVDRDCEKLLLTFNPGGYLRRG